MRLLVLGASGGCGQWLTRLGAERGHQVTAVARAASAYEPPAGVTLRRGDVTDAAFLRDLVPGHDVVLSALGLRRAGRSPWAPLRSPPDLTARVAALLVPAMGAHAVRRLVVISAGGVAESAAQLGRLVRPLVSAGNVGVAYRDLAAMEATLAASDLDWLAVRPVTLVDGEPRHNARPVTHFGLASTVRRADVAAWMLDAVGRPAPFAERRVLLGT